MLFIGSVVFSLSAPCLADYAKPPQYKRKPPIPGHLDPPTKKPVPEHEAGTPVRKPPKAEKLNPEHNPLTLSTS